MPKRLSTTDCPHCGSHNFKALAYCKSDTIARVLINYTTALDSSVSRPVGWFVPAYVKRCNTCGFLGFFDKKIVDQNNTI